MSSIRIDGQRIDKFDHNIKLDPEEDNNVGKGWNEETGGVPEVTQLQSFAGALASLTAFTKGNLQGDVEVLLVQITVAMRDAEATNQKSKINTDQEAKKAQLKEKEAKLEEAQRKLEEAERKKNSGSLIDKIKLAFEWLGAILAIAAAAVMIATGAGAVVGGLLMAAAVTSLVMAIDSTVAMATGRGIAGHIAAAAGASEEEIAKADMGFRISLAVLGILFSIGAGVGSAVNAATSTAHAVSQGVRIAQRAVSIAQTSHTLASTGTNVASTVVKYEETELRAEAKSLEAKTKADEAVMQMLDDMIDQALARLMASSERFNQILDEITDAMADRSNTLSRARFAG